MVIMAFEAVSRIKPITPLGLGFMLTFWLLVTTFLVYSFHKLFAEESGGERDDEK